LSPDNEHEKEYEVTVDKKVTGGFLKRMAGGVTIEGYITKPAKTTANQKMTVYLTLHLLKEKNIKYDVCVQLLATKYSHSSESVLWI
jgi:16S rRNA U516 pseudouridylate synthase RsuA-like enzyme